MCTGYVPDPPRKEWKETRSEVNSISLDRVGAAAASPVHSPPGAALIRGWAQAV